MNYINNTIDNVCIRPSEIKIYSNFFLWKFNSNLMVKFILRNTISISKGPLRQSHIDIYDRNIKKKRTTCHIPIYVFCACMLVCDEYEYELLKFFIEFSESSKQYLLCLLLLYLSRPWLVDFFFLSNVSSCLFV